VAGYFHVQRGLGIKEHLSENSVLTLVALPVENVEDFEPHRGLADLLALTRLDKIPD